ncbi:MAG: hypothetical protein M3R39_01825 [Actinomycetota bacterium]|nr:hypothetical protein [Actinomycetota bacterium]
MPLEITEIPSGTQVFDWTLPQGQSGRFPGFGRMRRMSAGSGTGSSSPAPATRVRSRTSRAAGGTPRSTRRRQTSCGRTGAP